MPLYEYISVEPEEGCYRCSRGFELRRPVDREPLDKCPLCRKPVKKLISRGITTPKVSGPLSVSAAKSAGFTVMEKRDEGVYEKL
ncbi:zinc ribbon domain-containing protein [Verrucomicrobiales bacterium]|nr:zinc ribbon domain-containing protein [Verrucomicrobiales bacterium]MDC0311717.1 zinc ribbon domain-containing protein [bacterium]